MILNISLVLFVIDEAFSGEIGWVLSIPIGQKAGMLKTKYIEKAFVGIPQDSRKLVTFLL